MVIIKLNLVIAIFLLALTIASQPLRAMCSKQTLAIAKKVFINSVNTDLLRRPPRVGPNLQKYTQGLLNALTRISSAVIEKDNVGSLRYLRSREFKDATGISVHTKGAILLSLDKVNEFQQMLAGNATVGIYKKFFHEEIEAIAEMPRFVAKKLAIELPSELLIVYEGRKIPINMAVAQGLMPKELRGFIVSMEMLTRLEELYHATDHSVHSLTGESASSTFNRFLRKIGVSYDYSTMTETSFAFYVAHDLKVPFMKKRHKVWREFVNTYPGRAVLDDPQILAILK